MANRSEMEMDDDWDFPDVSDDRHLFKDDVAFEPLTKEAIEMMQHPDV